MIDIRTNLAPRADHLEAIGLVIVCWAFVESKMHQAIIHLAKMEVIEGTMILVKCSTRQSMDYLVAFFGTKFPDDAKEFNKIMDNMRKLLAHRNLIAHTVWIPCDSDDLIQPWAIKTSSKGVRTQEGQVSATQIEKLAVSIRCQGWQMHDFLARREVLPPLPPEVSAELTAQS